jgi:ribonuclease P/MRP protein subunit RPP40
LFEYTHLKWYRTPTKRQKCQKYFGRLISKYSRRMFCDPIPSPDVIIPDPKPSAQCAKAARAAQTVLSQLTRAFHYRDRHVFARLYMQYVRPHLEFASPAWSPWTEADKAVLEKIQPRAVSMVSGLKGESYEEKLKELGLSTLEERRHQADMLQTFKIVRQSRP